VTDSSPTLANNTLTLDATAINVLNGSPAINNNNFVDNSLDLSQFSADQFTFTVSDGLGGTIGPTTFRIENEGYKIRLYLPFIGR
jgi:hypothetical protein